MSIYNSLFIHIPANWKFWRKYKKYNKKTIDLELRHYNLKNWFPRFDKIEDKNHLKKQIENTKTILIKDGYLSGR